MLRWGDDRNIRALIAQRGHRRGAGVTSLLLGLSPARRVVLGRRIRFLVAATLSYNVIEAIVALAAGARGWARAVGGCGGGGGIEVGSAAGGAWQCAGGGRGAREKVALKVIACSF